MNKINLVSRVKLVALGLVFAFGMSLIVARLLFIQLNSDFLQEKAYEQQTRDRLINPIRGEILDRNMEKIATNKSVASISVVNAEIENPEEVAKILSEKLDLSYEYVYDKTTEKVALNRVKTKVDKEIGDKIRNLKLPGVKVDEDIKRIYPLSDLASQVIGFVGKDNQGIVGLEAKYDENLKGASGKILSETDGKGVALENSKDVRQPPTNGNTLVTTIDVVVQSYAEQALENAIATTNAERGTIIVMNPNNGEVLAMANNPSYDLNEPFTINDEELKFIWGSLDEKEKNEYLNRMWRNFAINDTYEPGSTFKIFTTLLGLETNQVTEESAFVCNGHKVVAGVRIKCWRSPRSHGIQTLIDGVKNSCNPVFMTIAEYVGSEIFYEYLEKYGLFKKTGIDLAGEGVGIFHPEEKAGPVELATMSFGQSFQITPISLITFVSKVANGGYDITPHFAKSLIDETGKVVKTFEYDSERVINEENTVVMKDILRQVVDDGTGNRSYIDGYSIAGKTATSEKLPRGNGKYIASFVGFSPAENPEVIALVLLDEPKGVYYGGVLAAPVMKEVMENVLPYLGVEKEINIHEDEKMEEDIE